MTPKPATIGALVTATDRVAATGDRLSAQFAAQLAGVLRDLERQLVPLITDATDVSRTGIVRAARANRTRVELRTILQSAGYDDLIDVVSGAALDTVVDQVLGARQAAGVSADLSISTAQKIEGLKALQLADLLEEGDRLTHGLWRATIRGVFGARPVEDILADLGDVVDRTEPQVHTLYDTSVSIFGRQVEALQAGPSPETVFAYMGPADRKNRDFCRERVGRVYRRREIDQMDNGQLNDVFLTGGGYNCRHQWIEVSKFSELQQLLDTDQRIPEVARQLEHLEEAA